MSRKDLIYGIIKHGEAKQIHYLEDFPNYMSKYNHYSRLLKINTNRSYVFNTYKTIKQGNILKTQPWPWNKE